MEFREAIKVLIELQKKKGVTEEEKEALLVAIGTLDSAALGKVRIKGIFEKKKNKRVY